jgi:hypothetical protein
MKGVLTFNPLTPKEDDRTPLDKQTPKILYIDITIPFSNNFKMSNNPSKHYGQFSSGSSPEKRIPWVEITGTGGKPPIKYSFSTIGYPTVLSTKERPTLVGVITCNGPSSSPPTSS